ncbi:GGDEF domain-containing protein [Pseudomonas sp.]|jgi:diguanylate cyclase (GGDEF)-like protein|uniref:GGDEF domain-containing protein n=1 Tax=Pseudomonas sp. TaxID=306 RepID=UPI00272965C0|nr:GGDEF domain-containing protein [Pseudomonas sp.]
MSTLSGNTIDFDSARLKLAQGTAGRGAQSQLPRTASLHEVQQELGRTLQSSLELDKVLEIFLRGMQKLLTVESLLYRNESVGVNISIGKAAVHRCSYRITHAGEHLGELQISRSRRFTEGQLASLESLLGALLYPLRNALLYREAVSRALSDSLTQAGNRLALNQALEREVQLALRQRTPLSLIVADIDHFKSINDRFGHAYGDEALKAMANCTRDCLRAVDGFYRLGGEEFVILLNNTDEPAATLVAERIRTAVEGMQFAIDGITVPLTLSLGVATRKQDETAQDLLQRCDKLMYLAKQRGRNRIANQ